MNWLETILIIAGISLDIFAAMEIEGAMLAEVKKQILLTTCVIVTLLQLGFYFGGFFVGAWIDYRNSTTSVQTLGDIIAIIVFGLLGVRLLFKAIRRTFVNERRKEFHALQFLRIIAVASFYTIAAGFACGLLGASVLGTLISVVLFTVLVVIGGLYTGYHYGFELKTFIYVVGAVLLWIAGGEILLVNVLKVL